MFTRHVPAQEFLNKYNILDQLLRGLVNGDESRGMVSLYKDTLRDPVEQSRLRTMNKLRNDIAHGVFPSNKSIKVDKAFVKLLDKHIAYVNNNRNEVKKKMLVAMKKKAEKDQLKEKETTLEKRNTYNEEKYEEPVKPRKRVAKPIKNASGVHSVNINDVTGTITITIGNRYYATCGYVVRNGTMYIDNFTGTVSIYLPAGRYSELNLNDITGTISIDSDIEFDNVIQNDVTGVVNYY